MNNDRLLSLLFFFITSVSLLSLIGCSHIAENSTRISESKTEQKKFDGEKNQVIKFSEDKKYKVSLYTEAFPLTIGKIHRWILNVKTPAGEPVENVKIYVHGGMPIHQHGFPTHPRVTDYLGNGRYVVDGMKFSMNGDWEIRFNIKEEKKRDRVIFNLEI